MKENKLLLFSKLQKKNQNCYIFLLTICARVKNVYDGMLQNHHEYCPPNKGFSHYTKEEEE
jgi:hypothetical protein